MDSWENINYRGFYDVPRIFLVSHKNTQYLFSCPFDEQIDDYPDSYKVYALPQLSDQELECDWEKLHLRAQRLIGEVPVSEVRFDPSRRKAMETAILESLLAAATTN